MLPETARYILRNYMYVFILIVREESYEKQSEKSIFYCRRSGGSNRIVVSS